MIDDICAARDAALAQVEAADSLEAVAGLASQLLGKQGSLAQFKKQLGGLATVDEKKAAGQAVNEAIEAVTDAIAVRESILGDEALSQRVAAERLDLTEHLGRPTRGHAHLVTQAWERLEDVFVGLGFQVAEGPEVETDWHNFEALNMGEGHPARGEFDTLFVDHGEPGSTVLRTHTSPVQIRTMLDQEPPIYIVAPGRVFRRDTPDATHMPVFHQIEGLVDRPWHHDGRSGGDHRGVHEGLLRSLDSHPACARTYFPFTEPSAEFDIQRPDGSWIELGGCGMVHPNVLRHGGIEPEEWSGLRVRLRHRPDGQG